jgi:hypothetical protein
MPALMRIVGGDCALISCAHSRSLPQAVFRLTIYFQSQELRRKQKWVRRFQRNAMQCNEPFRSPERRMTLQSFSKRSTSSALES